MGLADLSKVPAIKYGKENEATTVKYLEDYLGKSVTLTGIWLHSSGIIGASADGLIDDDKVAEINEGKLDESLHDVK